MTNSRTACIAELQRRLPIIKGWIATGTDPDELAECNRLLSVFEAELSKLKQGG